MGSVQDSWKLLKFRHARIYTSVIQYTIHLENQRIIVLRNKTLPNSLMDSPIMKYFVHPEWHIKFKALYDIKKLKLVKPPLVYYHNKDRPKAPRNSGRPINYVIDREG